MGLNLGEAGGTGGGGYELIPAGDHKGVLYMYAEVVHHMESYKDEPERKVWPIFFFWEFPELRTDDDRPMSMMKRYNFSMHEKSSLRADLQFWRGKKYKEEELKDFDLDNLLGRPAIITVEHYAKQDGSEGAKITSLEKPEDGLDVVPTHNKTQSFVLREYLKEWQTDDNGNSLSDTGSKEMCDILEDLPEFVANLIDTSMEKVALMEKVDRDRNQKSQGGSSGLDSFSDSTVVEEEKDHADDIPF